ncbi:hypothetical protein CI105_01360 [Candidatus Izimaplasma bacterium ZiA1]|uniref:HAD-IA family hydrolase n=1 Tax=Candidatus Izimoplasma sp. ZiA1 TaxID=2024899 RepID=UPI000BAA834E|nr:hypothetical protein CI105_01360 [Candidatus Izimaplasma bacterium ZiA1]
MTKLNTILFDLDGTLIDTNEIIIMSFEATFKKHFPKLTVSRKEILTFIGPTLQQTFGHYTDSPFMVLDMIKSYREFYVDFEIGNFEIYPNVLEVIKDLHSKSYNLAIVTSKFKIAAWPSFTYYGLDNYIKTFISLDDVKNPKPNEEPVLLALSHFDNVDKAIMIGDNQGDILSGKNAGIYSAGVAWSIKGEQHLNEANPDFILKDIKDIYNIIKEVEES